jgi:hypothetical protein
MKAFFYWKFRPGMKTIVHGLLLLFISLFGASVFFGGCTQHVVDHEIVHDTIQGPAFLRFLAMLNNTKGASPLVDLKMFSPLNPQLFTEVNPTMGNEFIAVDHDSSFILYASYFYGTGTQKFDSVTIPKLKSYSMTTVVLFRTNDINDPNRLYPVFADDSTRKSEAPAGMCYIRLINGLPDYPQPTPTVNVHIDDINAPPLFKDSITGLSTPVSFQEIRNYVLMPAGQHTLYVRSETDNNQSLSTTQPFTAGQFYTIRLTGSKIDGTDQVNIDPE